MQKRKTLTHFILWCPEYSETKNKCVKLQRPYIKHKGKIIGDSV